MKYLYSAQLVWSKEDGAFVASVMELPGCMADGETRSAALEALDVVIEEWIATAKEEGRSVPVPLTAQEYGRAETCPKRSRQGGTVGA